MYDLSSPIYCHILGVGHPALYMSYTWSIFQPSLLFNCGFLPYCLVVFVPFFHARKGLFVQDILKVGLL
jgi:hypothetical protein